MNYEITIGRTEYTVTTTILTPNWFRGVFQNHLIRAWVDDKGESGAWCNALATNNCVADVEAEDMPAAIRECVRKVLRGRVAK